MPLDTLTGATEPITLTILDEEIHAHYYPRRFTGDDLRLLQRAESVFRGKLEADAEVVLTLLDDAAAMLAHVLADWDFPETADGPIVPLTVERLKALGPVLLVSLVGSFIRRMRLGETTGNGSQPRSRRTTGSRSRKSSKRS